MKTNKNLKYQTQKNPNKIRSETWKKIKMLNIKHNKILYGKLKLESWSEYPEAEHCIDKAAW